MEKYIYALTYLYEGYESGVPYASTLAVSEDIDRLREKMAECVKEDIRVDEEDKWTDTCNYVADKVSIDCAVLHHKYYSDLYTRYSIQKAEVI